MMLINCSECGAEISNQARFCPQCGNPSDAQKQLIKTQEINETAKKSSNQTRTIIWGLIGIFFGLLIMLGPVVAIVGTIFTIVVVTIVRIVQGKNARLVQKHKKI